MPVDEIEQQVRAGLGFIFFQPVFGRQEGGVRTQGRRPPEYHRFTVPGSNGPRGVAEGATQKIGCFIRGWRKACPEVLILWLIPFAGHGHQSGNR